MKHDVRSLVGYMLLWSLVQWSCQTATQPTAEIVPTPVVIVVRDQGGQPINGARVQWIITRKGATEDAINAAFARALGPQEAYTGASGSPGYASFMIDVPIADEQALILIKTTPPPDPAYRGNQKNGDFRIDTIVPCGQLFLELTLVRQMSVVCNQPVPCSDMLLELAPGQTKTVVQGDFMQSDASVIVQQLGGLPQVVGGVTITSGVRVGGQLRTLPTPVPQGQPYSIEITGIASATASALDTTLSVTLTISDQSGNLCWECTFLLRIRVRPQQLCDCPQQKQLDTTISACVNSTTLATIRIGAPFNQNQQCNLRIQVQPNQTEDPAELSIVQLNTTQGTGIVLLPGQQLDSLVVRFSPRLVRTYRETFVLRIIRSTPQGDVLCDSIVTVRVTATSSTPVFAIDSARSTLFQFLQNRYVPDTLEACVTRTPDPTRGSGTLCIRNVSACTLDLSVALQQSAALFAIEGNPAVLRIPPNKDTCIRIVFNPNLSSVYPAGRCNPALQNFGAMVILRSATQTASVPVFGHAELDVACATKAAAVLYEFGAQDANGTRYFLVLNILPTENTLVINEQTDGRTDSVEIYVQRINTAGPPPNDANITSAVLATGSQSNVEFNIVARGLAGLPQDICVLFNQYGCSFDPTQWTQQPVVREGDLLLFRYGPYYGILWIKKLSWSNRSSQALPQVEILTCYPFP
jgi:hypothetical protein